MGRLVAYMANRTDRLAAALHQERAVVATPTTSGRFGWGLGFYQNGEVLHKKRPQFEEKLDWEQVAHDVHSDCVVLHLRQPTVGDFRTQNTHPFRMRSWLFAHHGTIDRFEALKDPMVSSLPDFLARNIRGKTDSEVFFHVILSFLHDAGQLDSGSDVEPQQLVGAVRSATRLADHLAAEVGAEKATLNCVMTNGRILLAMRRGSPMCWVERKGLHDPPPDVAPSKPGTASVLRYSMVISGAEDPPAEYNRVDDGQVLVIDRDLESHVHALA